jgi:hypothetical protein
VAAETRHRVRWLPPERDEDELDRQLIREVLLAQHDRLRALFTALDARAVAVIRSESRPAPDLRGPLDQAAQALDDHLRGEERALAAILRSGPETAASLARLHEDHVRQREDIEAMRRLAASADDAISLALAVRAFAADVRLDMDLEDQRYLARSGTSERT